MYCRNYLNTRPRSVPEPPLEVRVIVPPVFEHKVWYRLKYDVGSTGSLKIVTVTLLQAVFVHVAVSHLAQYIVVTVGRFRDQ